MRISIAEKQTDILNKENVSLHDPARIAKGDVVFSKGCEHEPDAAFCRYSDKNYLLHIWGRGE